jgi:UDP-2,4-diacetamido-2,4,6-trideoxy-beta-L-altropyranose hydrolase
VSSDLPTLLMRADAGGRLGTGHVFRCLALAQSWQDEGGRAVIAGATTGPALEARLASENVGRERIGAEPGGPQDAEQTAALARRLGATWVVVDGYQFGAAYQRGLKDAGLRVLAIDDYGHAEHYAADLVLNQNLGVGEELYRGRVATGSLLLGTRYALLRREFRAFSGRPRTVAPRASRLLVTLGGTDPDNVTLKVIEALALLGHADLRAVVLVGAGNPRLEELRRVASAGHDAIELRTNVSDVPQVMAWADVAIAAGGTTTYELAFMGIPALVVVLADNQRPVAAASESHGVGRNLGEQAALTSNAIAGALGELLDDAEVRGRMAARGPELVDGKGGRRVVQRLLGDDVRLRPAAPDDCRLVWEWANEPGVRAASFSSDPIPWETHRDWFARKIADAACAYFIAVGADGAPVGQVRCDVADRAGVISIALDPRFRGRGRGVAMIRQACEAVLARGDVGVIHAYIRADNEASHRAFRAAGFVEEERTEVKGQRASRLALRK